MIYVMGFTSDVRNAQSHDLPFLNLTLQTGETGKVKFPNHKGVDDMTKCKGDLWTFKISDFKFQFGTCVRKTSQISNVTILNGGNDGWNIESVVTILHWGSKYFTLTADMYVNQWIDGNDELSRLQYDLTLVN